MSEIKDKNLQCIFIETKKIDVSLLFFAEDTGTILEQGESKRRETLKIEFSKPAEHLSVNTQLELEDSSSNHEDRLKLRLPSFKEYNSAFLIADQKFFKNLVSYF